MSVIRSPRALGRALVAASLLWGIAPAGATVVTAIDDFIITRSPVPTSPQGSYDGRGVFYRDSFGDGLPPASGGQFFNGQTGTYVLLGSYPASAESGGRLAVDSGLGGGYVNAGGGNRILQRSVLPTDVDPATEAGLKRDFHTFAVFGRFDLVIPPSVADGYGIAINDGGPAGVTASLDLFVRREPGGNVVVRFQEQDFVDDVVRTLELDALNAPVGADQIEFRLERAELTTDAITAAYRFWDDGTALSPFVTMTATRDFFRSNGWARGGFFAVQAVPIPEPGTWVLVVPWAAWLGGRALRRSR